MPETTTRGEAPGGASCDTLFYDGRCPLCAAEIEALRDVRGNRLALVDIHSVGNSSARASGRSSIAGSNSGAAADSCPEPSAGVREDDSSDLTPLPSRDELLRTLHLQRADGSWLTGADANVAAWAGTRRGYALRILRWPLIRYAVDLGYALWAKWRYWRLYGRQFVDEPHAPRSPEP